MGLALSSSHHYGSQPRVRAESDRHSHCNTLQLILVNIFFWVGWGMEGSTYRFIHRVSAPILRNKGINAVLQLYFNWWQSQSKIHTPKNTHGKLPGKPSKINQRAFAKEEKSRREQHLPPLRQSVKRIHAGEDPPPDGSDLTWSAHYHFAYESKMRCDNWSLV